VFSGRDCVRRSYTSVEICAVSHCYLYLLLDKHLIIFEPAFTVPEARELRSKVFFIDTKRFSFPTADMANAYMLVHTPPVKLRYRAVNGHTVGAGFPANGSGSLQLTGSRASPLLQKFL